MQGKNKWIMILGVLLIVIVGSIVAQLFVSEESHSVANADGTAGLTISKRKIKMPFGDKA